MTPLRQPIVRFLALVLLACAVYVADNLRQEHECQARGNLVAYHWGVPGRCDVYIPRLP